jgi:glycosyltransferase involved in cell wall biosynthesis
MAEVSTEHYVFAKSRPVRVVSSQTLQLPGSNPLVTVVMPLFNHRRYVIEAIRSVYAQTYRPIQLAIIDDGSSDGSSEQVVEFLAESSVPEQINVSLTIRENRGAFATINEGLEHAEGEYLTILNSDDLFTSTRIAECVGKAQSAGARMILSYVEPIDEDGQPLHLNHRWRRWYHDLVMNELDRSPSLSFLLLANNIGVSTGNLFFHRSLITDIGYFRDFRYAHDLDFLLRASRLQEPALIRKKLYLYRLHSQNTIVQSASETELEFKRIVADYLVSTVDGVANPLAPSLGNWPTSLFSFYPAAAQRLISALDGFIEPPRSRSPAKQRTGPKTPQRGRGSITVVSHELSHTGAPVLLLEIARSLKDAGVAVNAVSLKDGPLGSLYKDSGIPVSIIPTFATLWRSSRWRRILAKTLVPLISISGLVTRPRFARPKDALRLLRNFYSDKIGPIVFGGTPRLSELILRLMLFGNPILRQKTRPLLLNSFASYPLAFQLLQLWRGPVFWYIHETYDPQILLVNKDRRRHFDHIIKKADVSFIFGSDATREVWAREGYDGEVRYWSGLPSTLAHPSALAKKNIKLRCSNSKRRIILSVGTTGPRKGTRALIEAFAVGCKKELIPAEAELVIVGVAAPPSLDVHSRDLVIRALSPDLRGRVRLVGVAPPEALNSYYSEAEFYVQSSNMECFPLALLTAMAHGLPIVTTDADGCREAIIDGVCGYVVPPRQIELMAEAIGRLFASREQAQEFGRRARERFLEKFSLEATAGPLIDLLLPQTKALGAEEAETLAAPLPFPRETAVPSLEPVVPSIGAGEDRLLGAQAHERRLQHH